MPWSKPESIAPGAGICILASCLLLGCSGGESTESSDSKSKTKPNLSNSTHKVEESSKKDAFKSFDRYEFNQLVQRAEQYRKSGQLDKAA